MNKKTRKSKRVVILILIIVVVVLISILIGQQINKKHITIMLDPGHGGSEENQRGAILAIGGREVTINNQLTLKIEQRLNKEGYTVVYTNNPKDETDYVSLIDRSTIANGKMPDLFISIHHDAIKDPVVKGYSIYFSSYRPNIDDEDTFVLHKNKEYNLNKVEIIGSRTHVFYEDEDGNIEELVSGRDVYKVRDRTPQEVVIQSEEFASILYDELETLNYVKPLRDSKEKTIVDNDLMMTRSTNMASILIEAGFVSNEDEAHAISNEENQDLFAEKVVSAINEYFGE